MKAPATTPPASTEDNAQASARPGQELMETALKPQTPGDFVCDYHDCGRRFHRKTSLTNHRKAHSNIKSRSINKGKRIKQQRTADLDASSSWGALYALHAGHRPTGVRVIPNAGLLCQPKSIVSPSKPR
jgi:uncharacterized C2H2 Zn-finger protein